MSQSPAFYVLSDGTRFFQGFQTTAARPRTCAQAPEALKFGCPQDVMPYMQELTQKQLAALVKGGFRLTLISGVTATPPPPPPAPPSAPAARIPASFRASHWLKSR